MATPSARRSGNDMVRKNTNLHAGEEDVLYDVLLIRCVEICLKGPCSALYIRECQVIWRVLAGIQLIKYGNDVSKLPTWRRLLIW